MARFYGEMRGNRGTVTRLGSAKSGMHVHIRGWNVGVVVRCGVVDGKDYIDVWKTRGSNDPRPEILVNTIEEKT